MKKISIFIGLMVISVAVFFGVNAGNSPAGASNIAIYSVDNLSCGSCVANISSAFTDTAGVSDVEVDLGLAQALVTYDEGKISPTEIGGIITAAGYPSTFRQSLETKEYQDLLAKNESMSTTHVGKIGNRLVSNEEFSLQVERELGVAVTPDQPKYSSARQAIWQRLVQKETMLQKAAQGSIVIQPAEIDAEVEALSKTYPNLTELVTKRYGNMAVFRGELREKLLIDRYLEENIFQGVGAEADRQNVFSKWYSELSRNTEIVIYDQTLKSSASGGCGGACC